MVVELVLAGNGPGELSGWVLPVARAARSLGDAELRLTLALSPSQFAGGRELGVVRRWNLFDRIVDSKTCIRLALGLGRLEIARNAALVHLGGDLWFSSRLARRLRVPACALAETPLVARRHQPFGRVFAVSIDVATRLISQGVPREKIVVTGDPRLDMITDISLQATTDGRSSMVDGRKERASGLGHRTSDPSANRYVLALMPGSRDSFFRVLVPYFLDIADALVAICHGVTLQMIVSPFLSPDLVAETQEEAARGWPHLAVEWVPGNPWPALAGSDLALTIPGTNTLELAIAGVPFAVVVPADRIEQAPMEGVVEWIARIPGVGRPLKRAVLTRYLSRNHFVALPNLRAGRELVPEWVGRWTPEELAKRLADLLHDVDRRIEMATTLRQLFQGATGASRVIVQQAIALAESRTEPSR